MYDNKVACIQAKRIYTKLLTLNEKARTGEKILNEDIDDLTDSFTFFTDIIHLNDPRSLQVVNIKL